MLTVSSFTQSLSSTPLFSKTLSTAYERLSSGLRINQAADDVLDAKSAYSQQTLNSKPDSANNTPRLS
jgi:flagellin-like hook-associated protein FlgL